MKLTYSKSCHKTAGRPHNSDSATIIKNENIFLVADGLVGQGGGHVVSELVAKSIREFYECKVDKTLNLDVDKLLVSALEYAHSKIVVCAEQNPFWGPVSSTVAAVVVEDRMAYIAHAGNSRCYLIRGDRIVECTTDHSLLADYMNAKPDMTDEEIEQFPHKGVLTNSLGWENAKIETSQNELRDNDVLLLSTDGLHDNLSSKAILEIVSDEMSLDRATDRLVSAAQTHEGELGITAILIRFSETEKQNSELTAL